MATDRAPGVQSDVLRVAQVSRRIGERVVLDRIDLRVPKGTILGLVGPNGAGKSSLLRAIAGRLRVDSGSIAIDGLTPIEARRRGRVGVVPQEIALYPHLTVRENLAVFARLAGVAGRDVRARVAEGLAWAGLAARADTLVPALSGGMRRRVNVVASTIQGPSLLLLDEPTVGVDVEARARLHELLITLRATGVALVIATHDVDEATRLCDTVAVIDGGRVCACDALPDLVAAVVGSDRRVSLTVSGNLDDRARAALAAAGFAAAGDRWTSVVADLDQFVTLERALRDASVPITDLRLHTPGLADVIEGLSGVGAPAA